MTFFATLLIGLEFAVYTGVLVSLAVFLNGTMQTDLPLNAPNPKIPNHGFTNVSEGVPECPQLVFGRIDGPVYFGSVDTLRKELIKILAERSTQKAFVLKISGVGRVDYAGAELLIEEAERRLNHGGRLYLVGRYKPLYKVLKQYQVVDQIGEENFFSYRSEAISNIVPKLDQTVCRTCSKRIFRECMQGPNEGLTSTPS
ncbi:sodium-independent anion transporter [Pseudovibrio sp. Tun.PSC04-5.I4]|uniref:STAS domain-containing protein n=1 Tax=Pseudovibrio sp. Tun.PSC04-5.I4 TaxID=1798213 RepID=UPI000B8670D8|nr:sodium-independent anion transporter [Pseudovibrio sp. Tun.PSC04-5.I4]